MKSWLHSGNFRLWLAVIGASTLAIGAAYTMVQQSTRLAANDLPLQTAQNIRHQLANGATPQDVVPSVKTDLQADASVFAIITNKNQDVLASSASLDGKTPLPPAGVFDFTKDNGSDHFSWQPADNVREATQVLSYDSNGGGYIITGQSLKPAEDRITTYGELALAAWLAMFAWVTLILVFLKPSKNSVAHSSAKK